MLGRGQCLKKKPMYVWSTFLPFLFSMHSHLLLDPTGTWNNLYTFFCHTKTLNRWTGTPPLSMSLWFQAWSWTRGLDTWVACFPTSPKNLEAILTIFVGPPGITIQKKAPPSQSIRYFQQLKRWVYICLKPRGSHPLKSDDWKTTWYLYLLSFRNAAKKIYQVATNMFSVIKQVFFFKKGSGGNEGNGSIAMVWKVPMPPESGWLSGSLSVTQLGVAEDRFCSPRNEGPASSPWNPGNVSQTWFYLDGCDSGIQQLSETPSSSSRDLVWNHSCDLFFWLFRWPPIWRNQSRSRMEEAAWGLLERMNFFSTFWCFFGDHSSQHLENMGF